MKDVSNAGYQQNDGGDWRKQPDCPHETSDIELNLAIFLPRESAVEDPARKDYCEDNAKADEMNKKKD
ncbi:MAG: hypothetical protein FJ215_01890 [Ignavibacteria bacterium]|nr:hypothetical protein [Ignavibacteria bacterium]